MLSSFFMSHCVTLWLSHPESQIEMMLIKEKLVLQPCDNTNVQAMKLDVEYKEDKISSLGREVADLENRGADQEEV